ncbi:MAG: NupC/NupG family nucleoside CNT transporter [Roseibacillus sp.]
MSALISVLGMAVLLGIAVLASPNRRAIRLRTVLGAFLLQLTLGAFVLFTPWGKSVLGALSDLVRLVIASGDKGIEFLFGKLADFDSMGFIFIVKVLPVIIFFSSLIAVLYYLKIMPLVIRTLGGGLRKALGTSRAESLSATANIFVGQTEAPLVVKPYIPLMTRSELFAIMVGGLASIAGSVLAAYAGMGVKLEYLLAASFMAAPGGLLFAKILMPETDTPQEHFPEAEDDDKPVNVLDAAAQGASVGLKLALNVGAMLLAFIALIALLNLGIGTIGSWFGHPEITLEEILGNVFAPLAWLLGVPWSEAAEGGSFIGQKIILNEFVAYKALLDSGGELSELTQGIITFALCGFANLSSIAILLGGLGGIAPSRRKDIARLGLKAVFAASLANFMSAAIAGFFLALSL